MFHDSVDLTPLVVPADPGYHPGVGRTLAWVCWAVYRVKHGHVLSMAAYG